MGATMKFRKTVVPFFEAAGHVSVPMKLRGFDNTPACENPDGLQTSFE